MKQQFFLIAALCTLACGPALAQTAPAGAATEQTQEAPALKNISLPDKMIPIAEHYPGGQEAMYRYIDSQIRYPLMARRNRIQGECIVAVTLNADGTLQNMKILKNKGATLGEEALRVVKTLRFNNPPYSNQYSIPIIFKL